MLLSTKNLAIQGPMKLATRFVGLFYIIIRIKTQSYKLDLYSSLQLHPVFYIFLLKLLPLSLVAQ